MKISIVIPVQKHSQFITRCVHALVNQSFPSGEFEIIVVTDGPDDETINALRSLENHDGPLVRCYSLQKKKGLAAARNYGWRMSRSRLIVFTDADCVPDQHWLMEFWNAFLKTSGSKTVFAGKTIVPISTSALDKNNSSAPLSQMELSTANCACSKLALEKIDGFDEQFTAPWLEDNDLQLKFLAHHISILPVKLAIVNHLIPRAQWEINLTEERKNIFNALLRRKFPALSSDRISEPESRLYYLAVLFLLLTFLFVVTGQLALGLATTALWLMTTIGIAAKKLNRKSISSKYILQTLVTAAIVPILSLYWRTFGVWKFKALFSTINRRKILISN